MTIATSANKVVLMGNGSTTSFPFSFLIPNSADLIVYYEDANGNITQLNSTQYSVTGLGNATGGSITYPLTGSPIASGTSITILRQLPLVQNASLANQNNYYPEVVEGGLDTLTMICQQLYELIGRSLAQPVTDANQIGTLPSATARAGFLLSFDSNGNPIATAAAAQSATALTLQLATAAGAGLVGFLAAQTGAVLRTLQQKASDVVSVCDFGAVPDGATDSTTMIAAAAASLTDGQALYFPGGAGAYITNQTVKPTANNIRIYGDGPSSVIMAKSGAALGELFWSTGSGVVCEGLVFDGNRANVGMSNTLSYVVYFGGSHSKMRGCEVRFGTRWGIAFGNTSATVDFEFSGNWIHDIGGVLNNAGIGIGIGNIGSTFPVDVKVRGNRFESCYNTITQPNTSGAINGLGYGCIVTDNYVLNCYNVNGGMIAVGGGNPQDQYSVVSNNIIIQTGTFGSDLSCGIEIDGSNTVVSGNIIYGVTSDGIRLEGSASADIVTGNVISCTATCINMINSGGSGVNITRVNDNLCIFGTQGLSLQTTSGGLVFAENNYLAASLTTKVAGASNFTVLRNNWGYNGTTAAINVTTPAVPASGTFVQNNTGVDCWVYVVASSSSVTLTLTGAGAIVNVPVSGTVPIFLAAGCTISLTYSAAPTWKWMGV